MEMRRPLCSAVTNRPRKLIVLPLALLMGLRKVVTPPSLVHFFNSLLGISLKIKKPAGSQQGPSRKPMSPASFSSLVLADITFLNSASFLISKSAARTAMGRTANKPKLSDVFTLHLQLIGLLIDQGAIAADDAGVTEKR